MTERACAVATIRETVFKSVKRDALYHQPCPTNPELAANTGYSIGQVKRAMKWLITDGQLESERKFGMRKLTVKAARRETKWTDVKPKGEGVVALPVERDETAWESRQCLGTDCGRWFKDKQPKSKIRICPSCKGHEAWRSNGIGTDCREVY